MKFHTQCLLVRLTLLVITSRTAHAATIAWTNTSGGNWSVAANWNPNQTPGAGDTADITNNGTYTVTLDVSATVGGLILGGASGTQILTNSGSTMTLTNASIVKTNGNLNLGGGTLSGSGLLTVNGALNWTAGSISGALTVASNGVVNVSGSATKILYAPVTNANGGTINWSGTGSLHLYNNGGSPYNGAIHNQAGGLFDVQNDQSLAQAYGSEFFNNAGTLRKSAGSGTTTFSVSVTNTGTVSVLTGTLDCNGGGNFSGLFTAATGTALNFNGGGSLTGTFTAASGATLSLKGGSFTYAPSLLFNGAGVNQMTGGSITLLNDVIPNLQLVGGTVSLSPAFQGGSITNLSLNGPTLAGNYTVSGTLNCGGGASGSLLVAGGATLNWTAGALSGALTVASNGVLNLSGSATKILYAAVTNANGGTINWSGTGNLQFYNNGGSPYNGAIHNLAGGLFDIQNNQSLASAYGPEFFNNAGTLRKSAGSGTTTFSVSVTNTGTVEADAGILAFPSSFTPTVGKLLFGLSSLNNFGKISIAGNATLGGTVGVVWLGGYVPATNNSFTVLSYGSYTGIFTNLDLPAAALWATNYSATSFTVTVASINKLAFAMQPVSGRMTNAVLAPVVVQVQTPLGDPFATNGVPVTLSLDSGSGTLTQNTDPTGKATFSDLSIDQIGMKTLRASSPVQTPATSIAFKIVPLIEVQWTSGGGMLRLNGTNSYGPTIIYATTNLETWTPIYTNPPTTNAILFLDADSTNFPYRFYRAVQP